MAQIKWSERAMNEYRLCLQYSQEEFGTKAAKRFFEQDETVYIDDIWDTRREPKKLLARLER